jgi:hypothetical protein
VLGIAGAGQQTLDFFDAEDARQLLGWAHPAGALEHIRALQGHAEQEPQAGEGGINRGGGYPGLDQVQLEAAQIFG